MSNRGRHYYDPITQPPLAEGEQRDVSRIEVFQDPADPTLRRWCARYVLPDGRVDSGSIEDTDRDRVISMAQEAWPGLDVYELQDPGEDSTWEGMGPSPRLWQSNIAPYVETPTETFTPAVEAETPQLNAITVTGTYVLLEDVLAILESYAAHFDRESNPSAALGLREASAAFRESF